MGSRWEVEFAVRHNGPIGDGQARARPGERISRNLDSRFLAEGSNKEVYSWNRLRPLFLLLDFSLMSYKTNLMSLILAWCDYPQESLLYFAISFKLCPPKCCSALIIRNVKGSTLVSWRIRSTIKRDRLRTACTSPLIYLQLDSF
jgi:hypothetical protein